MSDSETKDKASEKEASQQELEAKDPVSDKEKEASQQELEAKGPVSDKEKETSQQEEKEKDTAVIQEIPTTPETSVSPKTPATPKSTSPKLKSPKPASPKPKSPKAASPKKPATPGKNVAAPGSARSTASSIRSKESGVIMAKGKKGKKPREDSSLEPHISADIEEKESEAKLPQNCTPLFLTSKTQEIFHCRCDIDVSEDNPFRIISKEDILSDMINRAAISDFHPLKQQILDYPGEEILIVYDQNFKFGQNFYMALTEEAKELILNPPEETKGEEEEEEVVYKYIPPEPKPWLSQGSEKEVEEETVKNTRERIKVSVKRLRRKFGVPCCFINRNCMEIKNGVIECLPYEDRNFDIMKSELTKAIQAVQGQIHTGTQTEWKYPRNSNTQYYARELSTTELETIQNSEELSTFVTDVEQRFLLALQQNAIMDVFYDDWVNLGKADDAFGSKADTHLKEYQSFTDLNFSKDKTITYIQWHPSIKGMVAVSIGERLTFDERIDQSAKVIMTPALILIWSFADPINPQLMLEAPEDIFCFCFCPSDHNVIAGGCYNGQVVLWDISGYAEQLRASRSGNRHKRPTVLPGFEDPNAMRTPIVRYCAVSSIEHSHKAAITDIMWMPDHMLINRMGVPTENKSLQCVQLLTCAIDNQILFWDTRPPKGQQAKDDENRIKNPMGVPNTFRHLDLSWKPMLKMYLSKAEPGGDHAPIKFSMQEKQGDRSALARAEEDKDATGSLAGGFTGGISKPGSGKERTLQGVQTYLYVGTEDGEVVYGDWMPQKDQDTGKLQTPKPSYYHGLHNGPVIALQRSPFIREVLLSVGGWRWAIWKEGVSSGAILHSAAAPVRLSDGFWSPTRPSVFYIAKQDGSIDIWDLLDKTHEPSITQSLSPVAITSIVPYQVSQKQQLLAVGDNSGTLHILEVPWSLRHPTTGELNSFSHYIDREVKRRAFVVSRWNIREQEKQEMALEAKKRAGIAPKVVLTEDELEAKQKQEYQVYLNEEYHFLRELGIIKEEESTLSLAE